MKDPVEEIRRLYFAARPATIDRDLARAIALLKAVPSDADRSRAAVFMHGLQEMKNEWAGRKSR